MKSTRGERQTKPVTPKPQSLTLNDKQFELVAQATQAVQAANAQQQLVLATILAGAGLDNVQVLRVDQRGRKKVLLYVPAPSANGEPPTGAAKDSDAQTE